MSSDFDECLKKRRIVRQDFTAELTPSESAAARSDLESARRSLADGNEKWATIQSYYAIFHAARALLFAKGYREKSHFCLKAAIQALYVDTGILEQRFVDDFDATMLLRETADYRSDFSRDGAEAALHGAERFLARAEELLETG
jgi:uncharacterized protein (UPF0332 family)